MIGNELGNKSAQKKSEALVRCRVGVRRRKRERATTKAALFETLERRDLLSATNFVFNEVLADPQTGIAGDANGDGRRDGSEDEFVELVNTGDAIDIGGWTLSDAVGVRHTFPTPTIVAAEQAVVVFGGSTPVGDFGGSVVQVASSHLLGLNNSGDTLTLLDTEGLSVSFSYSAGQGTDQSITRSPDVTGDFLDHSTVNTDVFSPGVRVGGEEFLPASGDSSPVRAGINTVGGDQLRVAEAGDQDELEVVLLGPPSDDVTVILTPTDEQINLGSGPGALVSLTFTTTNFDTPQSVVVQAVDDHEVEGDHVASLILAAVSTDVDYGTLAPMDITVQIADNDVIASPPEANTPETSPTESSVVINELDVDQAGTDGLEFIELFDGGAGDTSLDGLVLVLFNGNGSTAYQTIGLDGFATDADGYFVIGDSGVPEVDFVPTTFDLPGATNFGSDLQNGEDGVAIYFGDVADFPVGAKAGHENLVDAVVYETGTDDDTELALQLGVVAVFDEDENGQANTQSLGRVPDGSGQFRAGEPTPGTRNTSLEIEPPSSKQPAVFTIAGLESSANEGDSGTVELTFRVSRSGDLRQAQQISFAVASVQADANDFDNGLPTGVLTFAPGDSELLVVIPVNGDVEFELDESFTVALSGATGQATIDVATATGTIVNDDVAPLPPVDIWLNEFHYDNLGGDVDEFIEIAGNAGTRIDGAEVVFYNGSSGLAYGSMQLSGEIDDEANGLGAIAFATPGLQNGSPDGIALVNTDGSLIEFVSYEGSFIAADGPAAGQQSADVLVVEPGEVGESLQRPSNNKGGVWFGPSVATPGRLNVEPDPVESPDENPAAVEPEPVEPEPVEPEPVDPDSGDPIAETPNPTPDPPVPDPDLPPTTETEKESSVELEKALWDINGSPTLHHNLRVGDELLYAFNVTNTGDTSLVNVSVSDSMPGFILEDEVVESYVGYSQIVETTIGNPRGVFASVDRELATDPAEAKAWDNFKLNAGMYVDQIHWTGSYVEPFPLDAISAETDFHIQFYADELGKPGELLHEFHLNGGQAGVDDAHVLTSVVDEQLSPGGGVVYEYSAKLPFPYLFPGDYWISITALQTFPNPRPVIDPTWQWQIAGDGDGFYSYDDVFDDRIDGEPFPAVKASGKNLAFTLHAARLAESDGTLHPGQSVTFMGTYWVTQADLDAGVIDSRAIATADVVSLDSATISVSAADDFAWSTRSATLAISTSAIASDSAAAEPTEIAQIAVGASVVWSFAVTNTGNVDLTDARVQDSSDDTPRLVGDTDEHGDGVLSPGETWQFLSAQETAVEGQQQHNGVATAVGENGVVTRDSDLGYYVGVCAPWGGDLSGDGEVDFRDFLLFRDVFGGTQPVAIADLDCDGRVDFADFLVLSDQYGSSVDEVFAAAGDRPMF